MPGMGGMHAMPGMAMPVAKPRATGKGPVRAARAAKARQPVAAQAATPGCPPEHAAMGHCTAAAPPPTTPPTTSAVPPVETPVADGGRRGTDRPAGNAPPPAPPTTLAAARFYDPAAMAAADRRMRAEHGGMMFSRVMLNLAEVQAQRGEEGYRWDGEGWFGGDLNRLVVKSEGEAAFGRRIDTAEVQALYSRAIGPYFDVQAGVRQDLGRGTRSYAAIGVEGLAPYWFDVEGALFLSNRGDVLARVEGTYDQRITQRLILQPRAELNLAAQDVVASRIGAGLSDAELGLRLRYEVRREFAPYVGVAWERRFGRTARLARAAGEGRGGAALVLGVRAWF
ncbi:copper resistance protein B [Sphingomonas montana]|uniref:copper resistance protein B n=1 Tax=Sphingomonas montana TaxID=1843236 RepID=UPI00096E4B41